MLRIGCAIAIFLSSITLGFAQLPSITGIDKNTGTPNTLINISGSNFGTNSSQVKVSFGAIYAEVISVTNNLITVKAPAGSTFGPISVTNLVSGLSATSKESFLLSFGGDNFDPSIIPGSDVFPANYGLTEHCLCDFNNDGLVDIATANADVNDLSVFKNISDVTSISFSKSNVTVNATTLSIACEDLDGDGKKDLVAAKSGGTGDQIFVLKNISASGTIDFAAPVLYFTVGNSIKKILLKDLDLDGRAEIIATSEAENTLSIFKNISTVGNLNFSFTPLTFPITGTPGTTNLAVEDLNSDGLPELVASSFLGQELFLLKNNSTSGNISFEASRTLSVVAGINNLIIGDIDLDNKNDILFTNFNSGNVGILLNKTEDETSNIEFENLYEVSVHGSLWGLDIGDLNGDGKVDIAVASIDATKKIAVLQNTSSEENLSFQNILISTSEKSKSIKIGDLNNNGKPDLIFAGVDNSNIIINQNINCLAPKIVANNSLVLCKGTALRMQVPEGIGVAYEWSLDNTILTGKTDYFLDVTASGNYKVKITDVNSSCSRTSEDTSVVFIDPASTSPQIEILSENGDQLCLGDSIKLEVLGEFLDYEWSTGEKSPSIYAKNGGEYKVTVTVEGGCQTFGTKTISEKPVPQIIVTSDLTTIRKGQQAQLTASGASNYMWSPSEGLSDSTVFNPIAKPSQTTTYKVRGNDPGGCYGEAEITIIVEGNAINVSPLKIFSPNNDGVQDTWVIENIEAYPDCEVTIFSRSGQVVFEAKPYTNNWDGTTEGKQVPAGDYYFLIKSEDTNAQKRGALRLVR